MREELFLSFLRENNISTDYPATVLEAMMEVWKVYNPNTTRCKSCSGRGYNQLGFYKGTCSKCRGTGVESGW